MLRTCESHGGTPGTGAHRLRLAGALSAFLIFGAVGFFQLSQRADLSNLAGYPDESGHFVTGVCLLDYFKTAFGTNPVSFAESYYVRYPKVSFGHWPPLFYVIQAFWYGMLGVTTLNAILLVGCITALAASVLFWRLQRLHGASIALLSISAFLWLPVVRTSTLLFLADMLACLFMLLAVLAFCDGWALAKRRYWIESAFWTVMAILTKESALSLLVFALVALPLLAGKSLLARRKLYRIGVGFGLVIAVAFVVYAAAGVLHSRDYPQASLSLSELWQRLPIVLAFFRGASPAIFLTAAYGVFDALVRQKFVASTNQAIHAKIALVWLVVVVASQLAGRTLVEDRYFLAAYFPLTLLFAQGLHSLQCATNWISGRRAAGFLAAAAVALFSIVSTAGGMLNDRRTGYAEIAAAMPFDPLLPAILVSSDAVGEGSFVAERLIHDRDRDGLVLRASKMLSNLDLLGNRKLLMTSPDQVREFLNAAPVHFVLLDMDGFIDPATRAHHRLLEDALRSEPAQFRLMRDYPLYFDGRRRDNAVQVYENLRARPHPGGVVRIDMTNSLGRILEIRLTARKTASAPPSKSSSGLPGWLVRLLPRAQDAPRSLRIAPDDDRIGAAGGWGRIYVAAPGHSWAVRRLPDWMTIMSGGSGVGDGMVTYTLSENDSGEDRWAVISVGDKFFRVIQPCFPYIFLPVVEPFNNPSVGPPSEGFSYLPRPSRWHVEDVPGESSTIAVTAGGPQGSDSLVLERHDPPDDAPGATEVYFPEIDVYKGAGYRLSLWLKAQQPALIRVRLGQKTAPYNRCGLDQPVDVSSSWRKVTVWFRAQGEGCGPLDNRLSIDAGRIRGKLWLSRVSLRREALQGNAAEQLDGEGQPVDQVSPGQPSGFFQQPVKPLQAGSLHP